VKLVKFDDSVLFTERREVRSPWQVTKSLLSDMICNRPQEHLLPTAHDLATNVCMTHTCAKSMSLSPDFIYDDSEMNRTTHR